MCPADLRVDSEDVAPIRKHASEIGRVKVIRAVETQPALGLGVVTSQAPSTPAKLLPVEDGGIQHFMRVSSSGSITALSHTSAAVLTGDLRLPSPQHPPEPLKTSC